MKSHKVTQQNSQQMETKTKPAIHAGVNELEDAQPVTACSKGLAADTTPKSGGDRSAVELGMESKFAQIDTEELARLVTELQTIDRGRIPGLMEEYDDSQMEVLRASCLTLIVGPPELGIDMPASPLRDWAYAILRDVLPNGLPEASACHLWLSCAAGEREPGVADKFVALAKDSLWEPMQALTYRALAYYGRRNTLADLLPKEGPLSLPQMDALLEATDSSCIDERWTERIIESPDCPLPPIVREQWLALLTAERTLACGNHPEEVESELAALVSLADEHPPRTYAEAETRRIAVRAAAALARSRLSQGRGVEDTLDSSASRLLPVWEREYLQALARWQLDDCDAAVSGLEAALKHNPYQTPIRVALAALLADRSTETALKALEHDEPTREMFASRAVLLARLGRYDEAEAVLENCGVDPAARSEPARYSWPLGREQAKKREQGLRTALAERRGNWNAASKAWQAACIGGRRKTLQEARQLFAAHRELKSLAAAQSWRRSLLEQRLKRGFHEIGTLTLVDDALFFRAVTLIETHPNRATKDFQTLLRRRTWLDAERSAGGRRIVFVGDTLLRLGYIHDAIRAYELVVEKQPEVKERLALALVYAEVLRRSEPEVLSRAADKASDLAPASHWPQLLAALGLLIAGEMEAAVSRVDAAKDRGAPDVICRCLRCVCTAVSGSAMIADEDLDALRLPGEADAIVRFLCGAGTEPEKSKAFVRNLGDKWIALCPTEPHLTARRLLTAWCDEGNWDEALKFAEGLARSDVPWSVELATLVRVRRALERASRGELEEAERELREIGSSLQSVDR